MRNTVGLALVLLTACGQHHNGGTSDGNGGSGGDANGIGGADAATVVVACPGCPTFPGLGSGSACAGGSAADPQVVYPPDGVLLPPNMNVIEVQFMPGAGNTIFEIDFENSVTDVRLETECNPLTNTRGVATGGCSFDLDPTDWNYIATQNAGGEPVTVTVRGAPADVSCVSPSENSRKIDFAQQPLAGGIYYWQSVAVNGVAGTTGGIFRKDFGNPDPTPEPFLTPTGSTQNQEKCIGCHYLSRDGLEMVVGTDDADSDDELGDDNFNLVDVTTKTFIATNLGMSAKGYVAWDGDAHGEFIVGSGFAMMGGPMGGSGAPVFLPFTVSGSGSATTEAAGATISFASPAALANLRLTNPDWSYDGSTVYFTATTPITNITQSGVGTYNNKDDIHAWGGSVWSVAVGGSGAFGTPSELVTPANSAENDYYPAISPDGSTLIYDKALADIACGSGSGGFDASCDSYNNPGAELYALTVAGGGQVELTKADTDPNNPTATGLTNSWPRWSPAVQTYNGHHIVWVTFSSTRDYGLRVQNEGNECGSAGACTNCYPPVSPEDPSGDHAQAFPSNGTQPQLWMAAIDIDDVAAGHDGSYPAFWLPFQDYTAHNHIAQWVDAIVSQSGCAQVGSSCAADSCCSGEDCSGTGSSATCINIIQ